MGTGLSWQQLCSSEAYRGRWVALEMAAPNAALTGDFHGSVVYVDDDLAALCKRVQASDERNLVICFCDSDAPAPMSHAKPVLRPHVARHEHQKQRPAK